MRALAAVLICAALTAGCAAHGPAAGPRSRSVGAVDRSADGWQRPANGKTPSGTQPRKKATPKPSPTPLEVRVALRTPDPVPAAAAGLGRRAVSEGLRILAGTAPKPPRQDCSGFVTAVFARAGHPLAIPEQHTRGTRSAAEMLYRWARSDGRAHHDRPEPGDLAFFRDTYGKIDGRITHVALVESVDESGNVKLLHHIGGRYRRSPMNLADPHEPLKNGFFRKRGSANEPVLAGELFVAYARVK